VSRALFAKAANPKTGLSPDYANFDGTPHPNRFPQSGIFGYAAWRTASNWSVDWSWWQKAPQEQELSSKIQPFFAQQGMADYGPLYTLDGKPVTATPGVAPETHAAGLVATNAVASLTATTRSLHGNLSRPSGRPKFHPGTTVYYDGMLYLMSLLHVSGEFRILLPPSDHAQP
jgi:oligosaccharide reducing-end xylanase